MKQPLVSIVIPTYNVEQYVEDCLLSVLNQTYANIEVICVDDISTDNTIEILERYRIKDRRIRVAHNEEKGGAALARNQGLKLAKGKYIYFLDSDDYIKEKAIELLCEVAEQNEADCVFFDSICATEQEELGSPDYSFCLPECDGKVYDGPSLFAIMSRHNVYANSVCRRFFAADYLRRNSIEFPKLLTVEDAVFGVKSILLGKRMLLLDQSLHYYRRHDNSLSTTHNAAKTIALFKSYCSLLAFWMQNRYENSVEEELDKYLSGLLVVTKRFYLRFGGEIGAENFKAGKERHLFDILLVQGFEQKLNYMEERIVEKIKSYDKVIVYGAGNYAAEVVERLRRRGIKIYSLAVTKHYKNLQGIGDIPVEEIGQLVNAKKDAIVVLGVTKIYRKEVIATLEQYGYKNYIEID